MKKENEVEGFYVEFSTGVFHAGLVVTAALVLAGVGLGLVF